MLNKGHTRGLLEKFSINNEGGAEYGEHKYHIARTLNFLGVRLPTSISGTIDSGK